MTPQKRNVLMPTAIAAALLACFGTAAANEDAEVTALTKPQSSVSFGLGYMNGEGRQFGQYNGLNDTGAYGLLDLDLVSRDDSNGRWLRLKGRNLGLDTREMRFEHEIQGNWGYYLEYNQIPRNEPYQAFTGVGGIGGNVLTIPSPARRTGTFDLQTRRDRMTVGFNKHFSDSWSAKVDFRNETKEGARLWGRGSTGGAGLFEFAPEPIDSTTRLLDATLSYTSKSLQLTGGYYGTMYNNENNGLNFIGGAGGLATFTPIALPPDNHSHQLHLSGSYAFTPTTNGNFKVAYGKALQDDSFVTGPNVPKAPGIGTNLMGRIDTTLVQMGLTSRPLPKLTLRGTLRYDDRDDKTPVLRYNTLATGTSTFDGSNEPRSIRTTTAKVEASYALPMAFRLTGGVDYDEKKRNTSAVRVVNFREKTEETAYKAELRRSMSETLTGAIGYVYSNRDGSPFLITTLNNGTVAASGNRVAPIHIADRERNQLRLTLNWQPLDPLSVQFRADDSRDEYSAIHPLGIGPRSGNARNYSLDFSYSFSDQWQGTAWFSRNETQQEQSQHVGSGTAGLVWAALLRNTGDALGLGLKGKPYTWLELGADLSHSDIADTYDQQRLNAVAPATVVATLPEITTRNTRLQLFAKYAVQKNSDMRIDYIIDRFSTNDWTWTTWTYSDGTRMLQDPAQKVNFLGISYQYRWQ